MNDGCLYLHIHSQYDAHKSLIWKELTKLHFSLMIETTISVPMRNEEWGTSIHIWTCARGYCHTRWANQGSQITDALVGVTKAHQGCQISYALAGAKRTSSSLFMLFYSHLHTIGKGRIIVLRELNHSVYWMLVHLDLKCLIDFPCVCFHPSSPPGDLCILRINDPDYVHCLVRCQEHPE